MDPKDLVKEDVDIGVSAKMPGLFILTTLDDIRYNFINAEHPEKAS